ncbi:MAG: hypothetical protein ACYDER_08070 [Ktedonobacteraceae bacterium]
MADQGQPENPPTPLPPTPILRARKSHSCPFCGKEARLLVDMETSFPLYDLYGCWQYRCLHCTQEFSVDKHGYVVR